MGNITITYTPYSGKYYNSRYGTANDKVIQELRNNFKIIDVDYVNTNLVNAKIFNDAYFTPEKKEIVNDMLEFYLNDNDTEIYKKTDYLCHEKSKICICNTHADDLRKIYDGINYKQNEKYISWCEHK